MSEDRARPEPRKRVAFALARVDVEQAGNLPPDAATAWLYERIRTGAVETWYTVFWPGDPNSKIRRNRHDRYGPLQQVTRHDEMSNSPRPGFLDRCEVVVEDVEREVAKCFPAPVPKVTGRRGRPPKDIWPTIYVEATKHVVYESSDTEPMRQAALERWITERLEQHGENAGESTIREHAKVILRVFAEKGR